MTPDIDPYVILNPSDLVLAAAALSSFWVAVLGAGCWYSWRLGFVSGVLARDADVPAERAPGLTIRQDGFGAAP